MGEGRQAARVLRTLTLTLTLTLTHLARHVLGADVVRVEELERRVDGDVPPRAVVVGVRKLDDGYREGHVQRRLCHVAPHLEG